MAASNVVWHAPVVSREEREQLRGHRGATVWLTGLSGAGKSSIANRVDQVLCARGHASFVLDGDNVRHGLCSDLGFSPEDRAEHIRRVGDVARLFTEAGVILLAALVSPYRCDRDSLRARMRPGDFIEVYVATRLEVCAERDPKGLYERARAGDVPDFTGVSAPYEPPERAEVILATEGETVDESAQRVLRYLEARGYIPADKDCAT